MNKLNTDMNNLLFDKVFKSLKVYEVHCANSLDNDHGALYRDSTHATFESALQHASELADDLNRCFEFNLEDRLYIYNCLKNFSEFNTSDGVDEAIAKRWFDEYGLEDGCYWDDHFVHVTIECVDKFPEIINKVDPNYLENLKQKFNSNNTNSSN